MEPRSFLLLALLFFVVMVWALLFAQRRHAEAERVFKAHAEALRARAADAAPGSSERYALEAEAADVEAAAADWQQILKDEVTLAAPTRVKSEFYTHKHSKVHCTTEEEKKAAADERTMLLARHGPDAFVGVREVEDRSPRCWGDGLFVVPLAVVLLGSLAYVASKTPCNAPLLGLCFSASTETYSCAFNGAGACVATPLSG